MAPLTFIDSHCHLDASEFMIDADQMRERARAVGVSVCLIPAVERNNFETVRQLADRFGDVYTLGIHPLYVERSRLEDISYLQGLLEQTIGQGHRPGSNEQSRECGPSKASRLVGIGEIGLDGFVPNLDWSQQVNFFEEQLKIAVQFDLPVVLHVRKAVDQVIKSIRKIKPKGGIAHAFNGSLQQADMLIKSGFMLGLGGAVTYPRALHLKRLASSVPLESIVLETDAPDMVPAWRYVSAQCRKQGLAQSRNEPAEVVKIAQCIAQLRGIELSKLAQQSSANFIKTFNISEVL